MNRLSLDFRQAARALVARRSSSLAIVLVLAVGVGLTTAMFAIADPFVLRPLPYTNPDELVVIEVDTTGLTREAVIPTLDDWRAHTDLLAGVAAFKLGGVTRLRLADRAAAFSTFEVTPDFFAVLGVPGAGFPGWQPGDGAGERPVVLAPSGLAVVGREASTPGASLAVQSGGSLRITGTTPPTFVFPQPHSTRRIDGLTPFAAGAVVDVQRWSEDGSRATNSSRLTAIARLQPGVAPETVQAALARPLPSGAAFAVTVTPLPRHLTAGTRPLALGTLAACTLIVLICAGNVANLLMARVTYRQREFSTRAALGASRLDLARLALVDVGLLTAAGVGLGLGIAAGVLAAASRVIPAQYVLLGAPSLSGRAMLAALACGAAAVLVGLVPAALVWRGSRGQLFSQKQDTDTRRLRALRFGFAAAQSALAMVLAIGALLLLQSYAKLAAVETGFDRDAVVASVSFQPGGESERLGAHVSDLLVRVRTIPGVQTAAVAYGTLVDDTGYMTVLQVGGRGRPVARNEVSLDFFDAAGMPIREGRGFLGTDAPADVIVVNEAFAREVWPGEPALGQVVTVPIPTRAAATIIGVVGDARATGLVREARPAIYTILHPSRVIGGLPANFILRGGGSPEALREPVRRALAAIDPDAILMSVNTLGYRLSDSVRARTFATLVLTLFGIAGAVVTIAGLVGIVLFVVARRTRELAIRMALGARPSDVRRLVVGEAVAAAVTGGVGGMLLGRWLSGFLESFVYGVEAGNWTTALAAAALMLTVMAGAALAPARRAMRLAPTDALRAD